MRDLIVAGGGPVGLASALYADRAGLDVVVVEPRDGVIDKACGEGLMPGAVAALAELGVDPDGHPITGIRYLSGSRSPRRRSGTDSAVGCGVRRCRWRWPKRSRRPTSASSSGPCAPWRTGVTTCSSTGSPLVT